MPQRVASILAAFFLALIIFVTSVFVSRNDRYVFGQSPTPVPSAEKEEIEVNYNMPYPGRVLSDHILWPVKALRDKLWLLITFDPVKKGEVNLILANKRMVSAQVLAERKKPELAVVTIEKAQKYLDGAMKAEKSARESNKNTNNLLESIGMSALKHRQILEEMLLGVPEDAKSVVILLINNSKESFRNTQNSLANLGRPLIDNPFEKKD